MVGDRRTIYLQPGLATVRKLVGEMKCKVASVLLLLGLSSALAVTPASRHEHKLHLQQAKV